MNLLFVYGTLLPEFNLSISKLLRSEADFIGHGFVFAKLYDIGEYPGIVLDYSLENKVYGNVYHLHNPESTFRILDEYEEINSSLPEENEYIRSIVKVYLSEHEVEANVYVYVKDISILKIIPSGQYISYLKN
jgi:gamma-glutamylcyclotransferase (GGCT)/AIG2-like uncharacterized protein YtfP